MRLAILGYHKIGEPAPGGWPTWSYRGACLYGGGLVGAPAASRYALARVPLGPDTDLAAELAG